MAISYDNATDGNNAAASTLTVSHTTGSLTKGIALIGLTSDAAGNPSATTVTYGGYAATRISAVNQVNKRAELWCLVNPPAGANNLVATWSGSAAVFAGITTLDGVNTGRPIVNYATGVGTDLAVSVNVNIHEPNVWLHDVLGHDASTTVDAGQTQRWTETFSFNESRGSTKELTSTGLANVTWSGGTGVGNDWALVVVGIRPYLGEGIVINKMRPRVFAPGIAR